jgi:hypothetical protein
VSGCRDRDVDLARELVDGDAPERIAVEVLRSTSSELYFLRIMHPGDDVREVNRVYLRRSMSR